LVVILDAGAGMRTKCNFLIIGTVILLMVTGTIGPGLVKILEGNRSAVEGTVENSVSDGTRVDPDLVGSWSFEEGSGVNAQDDSPSNNHGTLDVGTEGNNDTAEAWDDGISGTGMLFDGKDDVLDCGNDASLDLNDEITIITWLNFRLKGFPRPIVSKHSDADPGYLLKWMTGMGLYFAIDGVTNTYSRKCSVGIITNQWYHVAVTFKDDIHIYIDGTPADGTAYGNIPQSIGSSVENLFIGNKIDDPYGFNGTLDEVRMYKRALTAEEVRDDFGKIALKGRWALNEDLGNAAGDSSDQDNTGVLHDADPGNGDGDKDPQWVPGIIESALQFDGVDDYIEVANDASLNFDGGESFSVSAWIQTTDADGIILSKRNGNVYYNLGLKGGVLTCTISSDADGTLNSATISTTVLQGVLNDGGWHYVAMSVDPVSDTGLKLFVDGWQMQEFSPLGVGDLSNSNSLNIGRDSGTQDNYLGGIIDQVEVWNWALEERDIQENYTTVASVANIPPALTSPIPDTFTFPEDSTAKDLINVTGYFSDIWDIPIQMSYSLVPTINDGHIDAVLNNYTITFSTNELNWTGNESFKVVATNTKDLSTDSNTFKVTVTGVNDLPIWTDTPPALKMDEDVNFTSAYSLFDFTRDAEDDDLEFLLVYPTEFLQINVTETGHINVTSKEKDYHGEAVLNITIREKLSGSLGKALDIPVTIDSVNDIPKLTLLFPEDDAYSSEVNITLKWSVMDVDDELNNITFDVFFGEAANPPKIRGNYNAMEYEMTDLSDMTTYYWKVIPSDDEEEGVCIGGTWSFTVDVRLYLSKVVLLTPVNQTSLMVTQVNLSWEVMTNPGNKSLTFKVYRGPSFDNLSVIHATTSTSYLVTDLQPSTDYYWKVIPSQGTEEGLCISGIWKFSVGDIPIYGIEVILDIPPVKVVPGQEYKFNFTVRNTGNRDLDITIDVEGNLSSFVDMPSNLILKEGEVEVIEVTLSTELDLEIGPYPLQFIIGYQGLNKTRTLSVQIIDKAVNGDGDGKDTSDGFKLSGKVLYALIGGVVVIILIIALIIMLIKMKGRKDARLAAEEERKKEEQKKKEEEERARFQAQQDAIAKDHGRWQRKDVDYSKFENVSTEGWEEDYMDEVREEMKGATPIPDMLAGAGKFELDGARPSFGASLKIESAAEALQQAPAATPAPASAPPTPPTPPVAAQKPTTTTKPVAGAPAAPSPGLPRATTRPVSGAPTPPSTGSPGATTRPVSGAPVAPSPGLPKAATTPVSGAPVASPPGLQKAATTPVSGAPVAPPPGSPQAATKPVAGPPPQQATTPTKPQTARPINGKEKTEPKKDEEKGLDNLLKDLELDKW